MHWELGAPYYFFSFIKAVKFYDTLPESTPFHNYKNAQGTAKDYRFTPLFKTDASGMNRRAEERTVVTCLTARTDLLGS
jgi:hypothetical protein